MTDPRVENAREEFMVSDIRKFELLAIAYIKHGLMHCKMKAGEQRELLERLNRMFDPAVLTAIEPMSDAEVKMVNEARSLDRKDWRPGEGGMVSYELLTRPKVFEHFVRLNPSILRAIKISGCSINPMKKEADESNDCTSHGLAVPA